MLLNNHKSDWENSYSRSDNYLFHPHEEVIRFISKYVRKRVGLTHFKEVMQGSSSHRVLDLGCGIGRHVMYCHDMGLDAYGVDLSETAIRDAIEWANIRGSKELASKLLQSDACHLPWSDGFFQLAVSHGVLDSMPFKLARVISVELCRVMRPGALFYCDVVSGDDDKHSREFSGEEVVVSAHEEGTVQLYFNFGQIKSLFDGLFDILECNLIRREDVMKGGYTARYHLVLKKI